MPRVFFFAFLILFGFWSGVLASNFVPYPGWSNTTIGTAHLRSDLTMTWRLLVFNDTDDNFTAPAIEINVTYNGVGWVAVGFHNAKTDDSQMANGDEWIALFSDADGSLTTVNDCWTKQNGEPTTDVSQGGTDDVLQSWGAQNQTAGVSFFGFRRLLNTTDPFDQVLANQTTSVMWALGGTNQYEFHEDANIELINLLNLNEHPAGQGFFTPGVKFAFLLGGITIVLIVLNVLLAVYIYSKRHPTAAYAQLP